MCCAKLNGAKAGCTAVCVKPELRACCGLAAAERVHCAAQCSPKQLGILLAQPVAGALCVSSHMASTRSRSPLVTVTHDARGPSALALLISTPSRASCQSLSSRNSHAHNSRNTQLSSTLSTSASTGSSMDRRGYDEPATGMGGIGGTGTGTGTHQPLGERVMEAIPGTQQHQATHGTTGAHSAVEGVKAYVPGTEEHRMRQAGVTDPMHTGGGLAGAGAGGPSMGERIQQAVPGTHAYEATHGMTGAHRGVEQMKAAIPGTEEHRIREGTHGTGGGLTGMGATTGTAGGSLGGTHTGTTGEHKGLGQKIKEVLPGTREHEEKKMTEGRM